LSRLTLSLLSTIIVLIFTIIYILLKNKDQIKQPPLATKVIHIEQMVIPPSNETENPDKILSNLKTAIASKGLSPTEEANQILANLKSKVIENTPYKKINNKYPQKHILIKKQPIIKQEVIVKEEIKKSKESINVLEKLKSGEFTPTISEAKAITSDELYKKSVIRKEGKWETISVSKPFTLEEKPEIKSPIMSKEPGNEDVPIDDLKPVKTLGVVHVSEAFVANE